MINILANKCLAFERGEHDKYGALKYVKVHIGFNEVPDWVGTTDFFKAAVGDKSIQLINKGRDEDAVKALEENEKLRAIIKKLEEKQDLNPEPVIDSAPDKAPHKGPGRPSKESK
jgi:hypothetical protein